MYSRAPAAWSAVLHLGQHGAAAAAGLCRIWRYCCLHWLAVLFTSMQCRIYCNVGKPSKGSGRTHVCGRTTVLFGAFWHKHSSSVLLCCDDSSLPLTLPTPSDYATHHPRLCTLPGGLCVWWAAGHSLPQHTAPAGVNISVSIRGRHMQHTSSSTTPGSTARNSGSRSSGGMPPLRQHPHCRCFCHWQ